MTFLALEAFVRLEDGLDLVLVRHGGSVGRRLGQCSGMTPERVHYEADLMLRVLGSLPEC